VEQHLDGNRNHKFIIRNEPDHRSLNSNGRRLCHFVVMLTLLFALVTAWLCSRHKFTQGTVQKIGSDSVIVKTVDGSPWK